MTREFTASEKQKYAERMRLGRERARDARLAAPPPDAGPAIEELEPERAEVREDSSRWVTRGRSHLISRTDPETGEILEQGYFVNRVVDGVVVTDWEPAQ